MRIARLERRRKIQIFEVFFFLSYFLYILSAACSEFSMANSSIKIIDTLCLVFSFLAIFETSKKRKITEILALLLLFAMLLFLIFAISGSGAIIFLFTFSFAAKKIQRNKLIKTDLILKMSLVLAVMIGDWAGLIKVSDFMRAGEIRNSFGFHHPNFAGLILLNIYLDIIFLRKNKKKTNILLALPFFLVIGEIIDSRNAAYGVVIAAIVQLIPFSKILNTDKKRIFFSISVMAIFSAISLYFVLAPMNKNMQELDLFLSGRIKYSRAFYDYYGITLFGNRFSKYGKREFGNAFYVLDNGYLHLLIHNGVLIFVAIMFLYVSRMKSSLKDNENTLFAALMTFVCIGLMEQAMFQPLKNPFLILSDKKKEDKK